ncbi:response regulator transcription factor [Saccharopolyspora gloriosae]
MTGQVLPTRQWRPPAVGHHVPMNSSGTELGRILVVDDDATVRDVVGRYLRRDGHEVVEAADGEMALHLLQRRPPDLVVLDLMLPGMDGVEVCRRIRDAGSTPVIMLTALGEESDRITGLRTGADDYVVKPFSPGELALRVASVLRRARNAVEPNAGARIADGDLQVDTGARTAVLGGTSLTLATREFDLLAFFLSHRGHAYSRTELLSKVWGWEFGDQSTVTVHVRRLREKVEPDPASPRRIATVWGVGYRYDGLGD